MDKIKLYLGISGKMGTGKSTLTKGIIDTLVSLNSEVVSLAKPIKDLQDTIYNQLDLEMEGEKDRDLLIKLGMWGREKDPDFWLKQAVKNIKSSKADLIICDDVRFSNEAEWFDKHGLLLRLEGKQRGDNVNPEFMNNPSEVALDHYDFKNYISNEGGVLPTLTTALYSIASYIGVNEQLMTSVVEGQYGKESGGKG
jgi:hypothetical protein